MDTSTLHNHLSKLFPDQQLFTDNISCLVKGTDAGLYRLTPKAVVKVASEDEAIRLIKFCNKNNVPLTFKAAGTSLSGQTISDSILMEMGQGFEFAAIKDNGHTATFGAALTGTAANNMLKRFGRKLGPKPASIDSAKIGGIVANNASGSSYGIKHNSYNTVKSMRIVLADGTVLDTGDTESCNRFRQTHANLIENILALHQSATRNTEIKQTIAKKYNLKNTCGYGVNSLIDFDDPIQIIQHLMIGSEGTLGFMSQATFHTVHDAPLKATAMIYFHNLSNACKAIAPLRLCNVSAAELMDRNALRAVENQEGMPAELSALPNHAAALLIDTSAHTAEQLLQQMAQIEEKLSEIETLSPIKFTTDTHLYNTYWRVRNGLFTSAAANRPKETACIIEDIAFEADVIGDALTDVKELLATSNYSNHVMWGHLLDGNVHFTVFPNINNQQGIDEYAHFMHHLTDLVAIKYKGSLKAEHGTGRNMAPFVEKEWGAEIYALMKRIKTTFDPTNILNPGVVINDDKDVFIKNLKHIPLANPIIDKCIECGFCEVACPSKNLTMTPRQRIVAYRHLTELASNPQKDKKTIQTLSKDISYPLNETCATDSLCSIACPVGIDTGILVKELRWQNNGKLAHRVASYMAANIETITSVVRNLLPIPHAAAKVIGYHQTETIAKGLFKVGDGLLPLWTQYTPSGAKRIDRNIFPASSSSAPMVVYFPACITRAMGPSADYENPTDVPTTMLSLLHKANYTVIIPEEKDKLCCGMAFSSKGFRQQATQKESELNEALLRASRNGELPIVCDMSPCLLHMKQTLDSRLKLYDQVEFIHDFLLSKLTLQQLPITVSIHTTCSSTKMNLSSKLHAIASLCATKVVVPSDIGCCGWAGDRGFFYPQLSQSALAPLKENNANATEGYSNSRTCEIGLSTSSGISYKSVVYLVDRATKSVERRENN